MTDLQRVRCLALVDEWRALAVDYRRRGDDARAQQAEQYAKQLEAALG